MLLHTWTANTRLPAVKTTVFQVLDRCLDNGRAGLYKTKPQTRCDVGLFLYLYPSGQAQHRGPLLFNLSLQGKPVPTPEIYS